MTESTQPADLSKSAPAVDMSPTFSARVMALPLPEPGKVIASPPAFYKDEWSYASFYTPPQMYTLKTEAAAIAAEADALAEAARGLRVALVFALNVLRGVGAKAEEAQALAALAAFDKAAGGAA